VRFLIEALLTLWFGPQIVTLAGNLFAHHFIGILLGAGVLLVAWLVWRAKRQKAENKNATTDCRPGIEPTSL
jgi:uncharacterized membrane protein YccC